MNAPAFHATGLRSLELSGTSFYLRDGLMEIWLALIVDSLGETQTDWLRRLRDDLRYQATIVFDGHLAARLDAHLCDPERIHTFVQLCRTVRSGLAGDAFVPGPLAARVGGARWQSDLSPRLLRVTDAVLWLTEQASAEVGEPTGLPH